MGSFTPLDFLDDVTFLDKKYRNSLPPIACHTIICSRCQHVTHSQTQSWRGVQPKKNPTVLPLRGF
jgi:uncharacterized protein YlaI